VSHKTVLAAVNYNMTRLYSAV